MLKQKHSQVPRLCFNPNEPTESVGYTTAHLMANLRKKPARATRLFLNMVQPRGKERDFEITYGRGRRLGTASEL